MNNFNKLWTSIRVSDFDHWEQLELLVRELNKTAEGIQFFMESVSEIKKSRDKILESLVRSRILIEIAVHSYGSHMGEFEELCSKEVEELIKLYNKVTTNENYDEMEF